MIEPPKDVFSPMLIFIGESFPEVFKNDFFSVAYQGYGPVKQIRQCI